MITLISNEQLPHGVPDTVGTPESHLRDDPLPPIKDGKTKGGGRCGAAGAERTCSRKKDDCAPKRPAGVHLWRAREAASPASSDTSGRARREGPTNSSSNDKGRRQPAEQMRKTSCYVSVSKTWWSLDVAPQGHWTNCDLRRTPAWCAMRGPARRPPYCRPMAVTSMTCWPLSTRAAPRRRPPRLALPRHTAVAATASGRGSGGDGGDETPADHGVHSLLSDARQSDRRAMRSFSFVSFLLSLCVAPPLLPSDRAPNAACSSASAPAQPSRPPPTLTDKTAGATSAPARAP